MPKQSNPRKPRWYAIPARVLFVTFLLTLLSFAVSLLLSILGLLDSPSDGGYWLNERPVDGLKMGERSRIRNRELLCDWNAGRWSFCTVAVWLDHWNRIGGPPSDWLSRGRAIDDRRRSC